MSRSRFHVASAVAVRGLLALCCVAGALAAQSGIKVTDEDKVLFGSARQCLKPAEVDYRALQEATPEFKTIEQERIPKGSARYEILTAKMTKRVCHAIKEVARHEGIDCVVVKGFVKNANGLTLVELTAAVLAKVSSADLDRTGTSEQG